ncbi:MAG: type II toxin-antitoxin system antitoxin SocA domain-containing protein [Nitrospirota bacterium]
MKAFYKKLAKRIKNLREEVGFSQETLAKKLGVSRVVISQIENGERKVSAEEITKLSKIFNLSVDTLVGLKKDMAVVLEKETELKKRKQMRINLPQKNLKKFKEVLLYILNKIGSKPKIGESVLYKLLYFIDFNYYERYEEQLIGATYIRNNYGPTPNEFIKIIKDMKAKKEVIKVESKCFQYPQRKYLPLRTPDLSILKASELKMIDEVLDKLSDMNATQISEYSHKDVPWLTTEEGKAIEYESVFYRTPEYSVRVYNDEKDI